MHPSRFIFAMPVLFITGFALAADVPVGPEYFPLKKGAKWIYSKGTTEVHGVSDDGRTVVLLTTTPGSKEPARETITMKNDGVYRSENLVLPFANNAKGQTWKTKEAIFPGEVSPGVHRIIAVAEKVKVPAGEFVTIVDQAELETEVAGKVVFKRWYAKGVGVVKMNVVVKGKIVETVLKEYVEPKE